MYLNSPCNKICIKIGNETYCKVKLDVLSDESGFRKLEQPNTYLRSMSLVQLDMDVNKINDYSLYKYDTIYNACSLKGIRWDPNSLSF